MKKSILRSSAICRGILREGAGIIYLRKLQQEKKNRGREMEESQSAALMNLAESGQISILLRKITRRKGKK